MYENVYSNIIHNSSKWKQLKCPSVEEWINKLCYVLIVEYYIAMKKDDVFYMQPHDEPHLHSVEQNILRTIKRIYTLGDSS